jgi:hypothetical protein
MPTVWAFPPLLVTRTDNLQFDEHQRLMKLQAVSIPAQHEPVRVAQLVKSVAGSRKNDQELIDLMKKVSETRGYSALHSALETIEKLIDDAAFLDQAVGEVVEAMARGARSDAVRAAASVQGPTSMSAFPRALRDAVVTELRKLVTSESFMSPLRTALWPGFDCWLTGLRTRLSHRRCRSSIRRVRLVMC